MEPFEPKPAEDVRVSTLILQVIGCAIFATGLVGGYFLVTQALKGASMTNLITAVAVMLACLLQGALVFTLGGIGANSQAAARNSEVQVKLLKQLLHRLTEKEPKTSKAE